MSDAHLEPAKSVIGKIGIDRVAEVTGKHVSRVYRWMYPKQRGGTDGLIPHSDASKLLVYAQQNGIELSPADFFVERKENTASAA
jgi:hypothetical protein